MENNNFYIRRLSLFSLVAIFLSTIVSTSDGTINPPKTTHKLSAPQATFTPTQTPKPTLFPPPNHKTLPGSYHVYQTFNNCGPASLSMTLSHYGIKVTQEVLGKSLRPYQNPQGDNDDKSVTLTELGEKAKEYGFTPYHRPNGTIDKLKLFITYDIPVITRTVTKTGEDVGHFRVVKGYDDQTENLIQDDSLQGKNLEFDYDYFNSLWKVYNYEYLVLVPAEKINITEAILGEDLDLKKSWEKAAKNSQFQFDNNPEDFFSGFNYSVALYHVGDYEKSVEIFERVEGLLPFRTLWYQIEPILAYYKLGMYDRVFEITDNILNNENRAYSELYLLRGEIYKKQGDLDLANEEFEKALFYNINIKREMVIPL